MVTQFSNFNFNLFFTLEISNQLPPISDEDIWDFETTQATNSAPTTRPRRKYTKNKGSSGDMEQGQKSSATATSQGMIKNGRPSEA